MITRCRVARLAVFGVLLATVLTGCAASDDGAGERMGQAESSATPLPTRGAGSVESIDACPTSGEPVGRGDGVPELELPCLGPGGAVQMAGLTGRPRLINIWASWCEPCRDEMPWLQQAHDTGQVDVLGVDSEDQVPAAGALLDELAITFPSVYDPRNEFAREVRVISKPTTLFVSDEGEVVFVLPGPVQSFDELRDLVKTHLKVDLS